MTEAERARTENGLTLEQAAKRARICTTYLRRVERHGGAPYSLAQRLAGIYGCRIDAFLWAGGRGTPD